jgi:carbonic anhydrase
MRLLFFFIFSLISSQPIFGVTPSEALQRLIDGNTRYAQDKLLHADHSADRRNTLLQKQTPFATVVSCSDSRVTPEIIFDQGAGDLFVVRIAGNVAGPIELDSVDYSVKVLGSSLILVLGHESCGAIKAVIQKDTKDIEDLAALIKPAVKNITNLETAIKANVRYVVDNFQKNPFIQGLMADKKLDCIGAYYNLATGKIEIL